MEEKAIYKGLDKTVQHKKAMLEALEQSLGVVTSACKKVGIGRSTFYDWMRSDEEFAKQVQDIGEIAIDFAESQLHKQIKGGNTSATIFYLKTKGKNRGYVERQEISGDLDNQLIVRVIDGNKNN